MKGNLLDAHLAIWSKWIKMCCTEVRSGLLNESSPSLGWIADETSYCSNDTFRDTSLVGNDKCPNSRVSRSNTVQYEERAKLSSWIFWRRGLCVWQDLMDQMRKYKFSRVYYWSHLFTTSAREISKKKITAAQLSARYLRLSVPFTTFTGFQNILSSETQGRQDLQNATLQ